MSAGEEARSAEGPVLRLGDLNPKQKRFCQARQRYIAYGGARGGGKTHVSRVKAAGGAVHYPGIRILFLRREYPELEQTVILPMRRMIPRELAAYNGSLRMFTFSNGSTIKFGHYDSGSDAEYQGQEYDWIFLDEATQFTESQFRTLGACLRGGTDIPRRMYLTCNPGGVGHLWVKRLFVTRSFRPGETAKDYLFIPATVEDNPQLLAASPEYVRMLDLLPENVRRAWRYGDWDALSGTFFPEVGPGHLFTGPVPSPCRRYRCLDYGLDMLACLWVAVDGQGRGYVYREVQRSGLIVSQAADLIRRLTPQGEDITATLAPPDLWSRQKDTGRTMAELFAARGVPLLSAANGRVQGWMALKEALSPRGDGRPGLLIHRDCRDLYDNLRAIQHDGKNPEDCAVEPHDITHICDAARYFAATRLLAAPAEGRPVRDSYADAMTGGEAGGEYLYYG